MAGDRTRGAFLVEIYWGTVEFRYRRNLLEQERGVEKILELRTEPSVTKFDERKFRGVLHTRSDGHSGIGKALSRRSAVSCDAGKKYWRCVDAMPQTHIMRHIGSTGRTLGHSRWRAKNY